ncbi:MAG: hypothetical protein IJD49_04185 [Clostridia bacterium]|nr:hypothetical protein [Clostridia bacterium]
MEKLRISTGLKRYEVNDRGIIFSFNPTDANLYARFLRTKEKIEAIGDELEKKKAELDLENRSDSEEAAFFLEAADKKCKQALKECFAVENDFDAMFDYVNCYSVTDTGNCVIVNFLKAITPIIERDVANYTKSKAQRAASKVKQNKKKRSRK